ncbi:MAG: hypothetical protein WKF79_00340 [Nocardioides sp.]
MSTRRILRSIRLDKIAAVDLPCQEHATVAIVKRAPAAPESGTPLALAKRTFDEALNAQLVSERISDVFWRAFDNQYAVREAFRESLADELADGGDGTAATEGFTTAMRTIAESAASLAREAGANATDTNLESAVEQAVEKWLKQQEETSEMKITTKAALKAAVASFNPDTSPAAHVGIIKSAATTLGAEDELPADGPLAVAKADPTVAGLQKQVAVLSLTGDVRKHYDALPTDKQDAFLAKSADLQAAEVEAANATDPVVYKSAAGIDIRKSDGAVAVMLAKRLDEQEATIVVLKADRSGDQLEKAAGAYGNVNKQVAVDMLKSVQSLGEDSVAGKAILKSLDTMNKGTERLFKSLGTSEAPELSGGIEKARTGFNTEVNKIATRDSVGPADAMSKARVEFPDLFAEAYPETAEQDA